MVRYDIPNDVIKVYKVDVESSVLIEMISDSGVHAGFPSPATDYVQEKIDLNKLLIKNVSATFITDCAGDSMLDAFVAHKCRLIVDRSEIPCDGDLLLVAIDGGFLVRKLEAKAGMRRLHPCNRKKNYPVVELGRETDYEFWGVVTQILIDPRNCD